MPHHTHNAAQHGAWLWGKVSARLPPTFWGEDELFCWNAMLATSPKGPQYAVPCCLSDMLSLETQANTAANTRRICFSLSYCHEGTCQES